MQWNSIMYSVLECNQWHRNINLNLKYNFSPVEAEEQKEIENASYWFWFYLTVVLISIVDFIEHITRTDSHFLTIWFSWLLFTVASTLAVCLIIYFSYILFRKLFRVGHFIFQPISIILGLLTHIYLSGPLFDRLIFGQATLIFFPAPIMFIAFLSIFYVIRLLTFLIAKAKSNSR